MSPAFAIGGIVVLNALKNLVFTAASPKHRRLFLPQLRFEAVFTPAMLVVVWGMAQLL